MAFALSALAKVYPLEVEQSFRSNFPHIAEVKLTALASDTALNLATVAAADTTNGPYLKTLLERADLLIDYFFLESPRLVSASGAGHVFSGTAAAPVFTFTGTASTPTVLTLVLKIKIKKDYAPVHSPNQ